SDGALRPPQPSNVRSLTTIRDLGHCPCVRVRRISNSTFATTARRAQRLPFADARQTCREWLVEVPLTAVCRNSPALTRPNELSPKTSFQDWNGNVFGCRVLVSEGCSLPKWAGIVTQGKEAWF